MFIPETRLLYIPQTSRLSRLPTIWGQATIFTELRAKTFLECEDEAIGTSNPRIDGGGQVLAGAGVE